MLAEATTAKVASTTVIRKDECECYKVIQPQHPHQCQLCHRKISACLYTNELQHKITLQAYEINQLKKELHAYELEKRKQDLDFQTLNSKYIASLDTMTDIQFQKEQADRELEELSARLFEEANCMVASEKKKRVQLQSKLDATEDQLLNERNQLQELKSRMESLLQPTIRVASSTSTPFNVEYTANYRNASNNTSRKIAYTNCRLSNVATDSNSITDSIAQNKSAISKRRNTVASSILLAAMSPVSLPPITFTNKHTPMTFDFKVTQAHMFRSFLDLYGNSSETSKRINRASSYFDSESEEEETEKVQDILSIENSNHSSFFYYTHPQIVLPPAQQSEYIMQCEKEDIEPCLGFGNPESRMCVKVMMEYMLHKPCFIEHITLDVARNIPPPTNAISSAYYRPLWERWSVNTYYSATSATTSTLSNLPETKQLECASCGRKTNLKQPSTQKFYRFRLVEEDDWLLIDHDCRNRLVAVCDFYSFIRNIQLGLYQNRSFHDLYQENVQLRLKMFYSR
ncbi:Arf GTPase arl1 [Mucor velutinosus]|uniref:Arf GTPase arl1 n=1 Tax=Mucor velutinosus TaxID=708070 RepID=A0AAN7DPF1_9FUNG|nr:Arf GTPase arl1 [Mucor velutinosus]